MGFRKLTENEIEARIAMVKPNGLSLLLYKDARVDQTILDETFGMFGWKREHQLLGDRLYCTVSVKNPETGEWISKQDVGTESYTEKEKGQASDSFKRACFNWGIGRELYTAPFIWITPDGANIKDGKCYDRFSVKHIDYDGNKISALQIYNENLKKVVYSYGSNAPANNNPYGTRQQMVDKFYSELKRTGKDEIEILKQCEVEVLSDMSDDTLRKVLAKFAKTEDKK